VKERDVELVHVRTNEHVADIFTKPLKIKNVLLFTEEAWSYDDG
jgi:hypothetical protein